ncbi:PI31 proteasome regulator N-terminal-domain-containing protein [Stachybotrys elegans]|uniref:PI31 proteasome regulator N-terminal-domain-containing protein n=1 Tax=Stachybotrys elegans TaxID=80388 RepID=A0A8K0WT10_9HYPO|nr:PI31 proteasome regulator N-terminal-domain-containing protein [Stachybotrys elegans]
MSRLGVDAILQGMADALPTHPPNDDSSDLASSYEAIALLLHAYLAALGFKLQGFSEDKTLPECESLAPRLPPQWNRGFGSFSFVYRHKQSSMRFVFRVDRMGTKVEIRGLAEGDDNIHRFERVVRDIISPSGLPVKIAIKDDGTEDRSNLVQQLRRTFVSDDAVAGIIRDTQVSIIQKLIPKLQSEDYEEIQEAQDDLFNTRRREEQRNPDRPFPTGGAQPDAPYPRPGPLPEAARAQPRPTGDFPPPGFDDEYDLNRPPRGGLMMPGRSPYNIGHDDLHPPGLGPHDPFRGSFTGGGLPRPGGSSGMHPTFDDPLFGGPGNGGDQGGFGYNPQAPPGARWDPLGPGGGPRFPGPGGGRGGSPFGGNSFGGGGGII